MCGNQNEPLYGEAFITMVGRPGPVLKSKGKIFIDFVFGPSAVIFALASWHWLMEVLQFSLILASADSRVPSGHS